MVKLSSLKEQLRAIEKHGNENAWPPDERADFAELTKEIAELEKALEYRKAA